MTANHSKQNKFVVVYELQDFVFALPKEEFLSTVKQEFEYGNKDLLTDIEKEYDRRQYTVE
jgi:hypothetical protein